MLRISRAALGGAFATVLVATSLSAPVAFAEPVTCTSASPSADGSPSTTESPSPSSPTGSATDSASPSVSPSPTSSAECSTGSRTPSATSDASRSASTSPDPSSPDPSSPDPSSPDPSDPGATSASPSQSGSAPTDDASPSADESADEPTASATARRPQAKTRVAAAKKVSLSVAPKGSPIKGRYFQDIGSYAFSGTVSPATSGQKVEVWWSKASGSWHKFVTTKAGSGGKWSAGKETKGPGIRRFRATLGGDPSKSGIVRSAEVKINIEDAKVYLDKPKSSIDSLTSPKISGTVFPARSGVLMHFQVKSGKAYHDKGTQRTDSKGKFSFTFSTGKGELHSYGVRARYWDGRIKKWEISHAEKITRARVLNAKVTKTTAAEVAKTYHAGCPVGRSKLRTIKMNYEDFSHKMHRGIMIVRSDRTDAVIASFGKNLGKPIRRMDNPNVWNGNDPKQMEADNTSAFNCRKVTGNPYAQSPHSYGIAIDVNTRENPYRDVNGKWWPKSGKKYIKRSPWKVGMLNTKSTLTKQLRSRGYFWGGFWNPGRDYQHFEYNK